MKLSELRNNTTFYTVRQGFIYSSEFIQCISFIVIETVSIYYEKFIVDWDRSSKSKK